MTSFKILEEKDIKSSIPMLTAIQLMRDAFVQISERSAEIPIRVSIEEEKKEGRVLFMPAYSPKYHLFGLKMVSVFPSNSTKQMPVIQGKMLAIDDESGVPLGVIDAGYLTALRTGAASGLASDLLSLPESKVLAIFGTGTQAITQVEAILCVREISKILVFGTSDEKERNFCKMLSSKHKVICESGNKSRLKEADIICTTTTSTTPLFQLSDLKDGVHINGIGSFKPEMNEIASDVIQSSLLIVDHIESALSEAGDIIIPIQKKIINRDHIYAELGEIVSGRKQGRTSSSQITVFKSVGNAVQDLAIASHLLK